MYFFFFPLGCIVWPLDYCKQGEQSPFLVCVCVDPYCLCSFILSALNRNFFKIGAEEKFGLHSFAIQSTSKF